MNILLKKQEIKVIRNSRIPSKKSAKSRIPS